MLVEGASRHSRTPPTRTSMASRAEGRPAVATLFVELAVQMQTLEDEFNCRGDCRGVARRAELRDRALHAGDLERLLHVLAARLRRRDMHRRAATEGREERVELRERERAVEDVEHGTLDETLDDTLLRDVA